jgi:CubicO group peptidase (beta-lactamase class C family)
VIIRQDDEIEASGVAIAVPWWSFTKTALAIAMLRLWEQNRIDLDTPIEGKQYTAAQLLRHEAGLPDYGSLPQYHADVEAGALPWPLEDLLKVVGADRLRYAPGQSWAYSNIGYREVARLIELASQQPLADALADLVFLRAELSTARLVATPDDLAEVCMGDVVGYHPGWVYHGLIVGTPRDAARLLHFLLKGRLLESRSFARMIDRRPLPQFRSAVHPDPAYGLGLMLRAKEPTIYPMGHSGSGPGSKIAVYGKRNRTCAVWASASSGIDPEAEAFKALQERNP